MLLRGICVLSLIISAAVCGISGGFAGLGWLWLLPVGFVGSFLMLLLMAFLFLCLICALVDIDKPRDADSPFYRQAMYLYEEAIAGCLGVRLHTSGLENTPAQGRFLLVCNHIFIADPALLHLAFRRSQLAFISKQENRDMFVVGKMMHMTLCQTLNRDNDREALKTILKCIQLIKEDKASIGVFPEGYTSKDRKLHHFRGGVFKIAQKANVPIVVCTLRNTHNIIRNALKLKKTDVDLRLVGVIPAEELKGRTAVEISDRVHAMMAADLSPELVAED